MTAESHPEDEASARSGAGSYYREFLEDHEELMRHKWLMSEKAGHDVGLENALMDWVTHHRAAFHRQRAGRRAEP